MVTAVEACLEHWRTVLRAGGSSTIARWTRGPESGVAEHEAPVSGGVAATLRGLADELGLPLSAVLLAAHAKVLSALTGEAELTAGYVAKTGGLALPCRLDVGSGPWRELLDRAHLVEDDVRANADLPGAAIEQLRAELGLPGLPFETVFDPTRTDGDLDAGIVLRVGVSDRGGELALRLRYRTEEFDAATAARMAGYHLTALSLIAADPAAEHTAADLLAADELEFQLDGLAGPERELPDCRPHELFERRVAAHPDRVAAVHAGREWTYRELNSRANQLAQALLSRGLRREGVVAVVTERNLDWMAAVLAVFKAGGVYLPIEPHFPSDRIATTLRRADCQLVLTESASTTTLEPALAALPGVPSLFIEQCYGEGHADGDLGLEITPGQLAYVYFTSGSTGEPKGAMCEQAGMLNHLFAKIDDLRIGDGSVVAQTAPQCFDISLWQLIAAVLVGGRTLLIEQDVVLDVERFVDTVVGGRVSVLQIVPSYLEVVLTYLEQHPRELPDLRCVSVTGEALKKELTQRWFAAEPQIVLVNAYGLTETSDDTNHAVLDRVPERAGVPLGPCVNNVRVYIVDENLRPVPLGAPGEIVFSGVCVGRGYINDPDRTAAAFMADPHRAGERLYRSGDFGRWAPDGNLEFLGRRDAQVKISGFRIEIGEIENTLLLVPGVRDGAVVVAERVDGSKYLVAFYAGPAPLDVDALRERLGESLPVYMVPTAVHWREALPLTANSKIDKKALRVLATELDASRRSADESDTASDDERAPASPNERRLAEAWAKVLGVGVDQIGRHDHFFDRGGTSLLAVKLAIALKREVSLKDLTRHPVLADLGALLDGRQAAATADQAVAAERATGLLQLLAEGGSEGERAGTLVCFPYAGGNAVNFQPMARALRDSGLAVYAVELPGHDLTGRSESFAPLERVVEQVVGEIEQLVRSGAGRVLLWGHSSGAAPAVATAQRLAERGIDVARVFLAAQLPGTAADRRAAAATLAARGTTDIARGLAADGGYTELGELDAPRAEHVGAAYRHDCLAAHHYLADALDSPSANRLVAPVTVVVAADDPATAGFAERHREWAALAEHVELHELPDGGHYFLRTRPERAAEAVARAAAPTPTSAR